MDLSELHLHWREGKHKNRTYRSYSLAKAYRQDGKNRKHIVLKLGKLTQEEANKWRSLLKALKNSDAFVTTLDEIVVSEQFAYLDAAVVSAVWDEWLLDLVFTDEGKRTLGIAAVARILTLNRCLNPAAKSQAPEWFMSTALQWILNVEACAFNASRIFRELTTIESHKEALCRHLYERLSAQYPESMNSVFYDLSSTTFSGTRCVLMKWGHCKEGFKNHVVLALVVNQEGFPFYWEVLPGGTADATTISWLLERLGQRFSVDQSTMVFDRGMVSDQNLSLIEQAGIKYITAMDRNQIETCTDIDFSPFAELDPERIEQTDLEQLGLTAVGDGTWYRDIPPQGERRYILCLNPRLLKDQRAARKQAITDAQAAVKELNATLSQAKRSRQRKLAVQQFRRILDERKVDSFVDVKVRVKHLTYRREDGSVGKIRTYRGTLVLDEKRQRHAGRLDGLWLLVTNHREKTADEFLIPAEQAIAPYREKAVIESAFRDIKSCIDIAPVYVWTEQHVKAHYTICVLAYLINRTLTKMLHERHGRLTGNIVTHNKLYEELAKGTINRIQVKNVDVSTISLTQPTKEIKELVDRVGMSGLLSTENIKNAVNISSYGITSKKKL